MTNFLNDKYTPALLPEVCAPRRSLLELFRKAAAARLVYVSAPAGYGKTVSTLLWLKNSGLKSVWFGLDSYDNSPSVFYKLFGTGLLSVQPENENMKKILQNPAFSSSPVEHTIELLSEFIPEDIFCALIFDDMHLITNEEILKSFFAVIKRLPHTFIILILTRTEPLTPVVDLAKIGRAEIISKEQLMFSESETHCYFLSVGLNLTPEESKSAYTVTNGWAIGINAIAKSGRVSLGKEGHMLEDYIKTQIWENWDAAIRSFMLKTAVVDEFDCELASTLTDETDSKKLLDKLCAENSFISYQGNNLYRYHHLFLDFLRAELLAAKHLRVNTLYKRAAQYYREKDNRLLSLHYYLKSGDYKGIGPYFYSYVFDENNRAMEENIEYFKSLFSHEFPKKAFSEYPALHISAVWYNYVTGRYIEMERHLDALYRNIPRIALKNPEYMEYVMLAHSVDHRTSFVDQIKRYNTYGSFISKLSNGKSVRAIVSFTHNMPYGHRSNRDYSDLVLEEGIMERLDETFAKLLGPEWVYARPVVLGGFLYEKNKLKSAFEKAVYADNVLTEESSVEGHFAVKILLHSVLYAMGDTTGAKKAEEDLENLVKKRAKYFTANLEAYKTRLQLWNGNKTAAAAWFNNYFVAEIKHIEMYKVFQHFITARAYIVLGKYTDALRYVLKLEQYGVNYHRPLDIAEAGTLKAVLEWNAGLKKEAQETLEATLRRMQPYGFIRVIADEGALVLPILKRIEKKIENGGYTGEITQKYINDVILSAHEVSKRRKGLITNDETGRKAVKLSKQQKQMLEFLSQGYKNAKIAELTGLKIPTIKSHTSIAYQKLGVNNAMDAVLKARELGILE